MAGGFVASHRSLKITHITQSKSVFSTSPLRSDVVLTCPFSFGMFFEQCNINYDDCENIILQRIICKIIAVHCKIQTNAKNPAGFKTASFQNGLMCGEIPSILYLSELESVLLHLYLTLFSM